MDCLERIAIISSIVSCFLAVYSIYTSNKAEKQSTENFRKTEDLLKRIQEVALSNQRDIGYANKDLEKI